MRKSFNPNVGIKGQTNFCVQKLKPKKRNSTIDSQDKVDNCLSCTKPANLCKGSCYGKY